ncbi:STAGA complex 65 subunit gamma isoform X3 [Cryptotermes secundus]|nr:STAGA complex 65 subunit gamma isoform X3 [Cryptotermes secundus]
MEHVAVHWGEMPESQNIGADTIPVELRNLLILKAMKPDPFKLHQPCKQEDSLFEVPQECTSMDSTVLHTVQLLQHCKTLQSLIRLAEQSNESDSEVPKPLPPAPPVPEKPERIQSYEYNFPLRYMEKKFSTFSEGQGSPPPRLSSNSAKKILRKSVATLFAHIGYDNASQCVLDTMTDVTEEYIQKFTHLLRVAVDQESVSGSAGFPDAMERVFYEMGVGSVRNLHVFYQMRVLKYHERMLRECNRLHDEYASLALPALRPANDCQIIRCGSSETVNEEDVPEIHFPALGDGYSADELQPSLEPGFQMLHSLEQDEQLLANQMKYS